jgi:hypothetical protein
MTADNNETEYSTNEANNAAEQHDSPPAENAVSHGGRFGTDDTLGQYEPKSTDDRS